MLKPNFKTYVNFGSNNIIITITNVSGKTLYWTSSGKRGLSGSKKSTIYSYQTVIQDAKLYLESLGLITIDLIVKGFNTISDNILKEFNSTKYDILSISECTPIAFNGCKPRKLRRV